MFSLSTAVLLAALPAAPPAKPQAAADLAPPVPILAEGKPIDVDVGHAAPCVADLKGDGTLHLLVGQFGEGKLRIYPNAGTKAEPRFDRFEWFRAGGDVGKVPAGWCVGFTPQFVDFDGDGNPDILSGSWPGELYLFRGEGKGRFAAGQVLKDKDGKPIKVGSASTVFACDWRGAGKLDLLCGCIEGFVWLVPNEGTRDKPAYGKPVKLQAGGKDIAVTHGDSHPVLADWEGTGRPGLVVGCGDGGVAWYKNVGTRAEPKLAEGRTLVAAPPMTNPQDEKPTKELTRGSRAKVWVGDWNGDGHPDLLVGDFFYAVGEQPKLTEEDRKRERELRAKAEELQKKLQPFFTEYTKLYRQKEEAADADKAALEKKMQELSDRYKAQLEEQSKLYAGLQKFRRPMHLHGHVWLYLRQPPTRTSSR